MLGRIAAGTPIEALSDPTSYMSVPEALVSGGDHFALEIVGDSMIEAGIHEGDTVIIKRTDNANSGDIVVALVEEHEATLKTLRKEPGRIGLEAANPRYETRYFETDQVRIQGRLTGLIRRYWGGGCHLYFVLVYYSKIKDYLSKMMQMPNIISPCCRW